ncbi:MAG: hypothetical protein QM811_29055 [Pirellulales bacterium]
MPDRTADPPPNPLFVARRVFPCALVAALFILGLVGCATFGKQRPSTTPAEHTVQLDRLTVHSDVLIASDHRVLQDLTQLRGDVRKLLELPDSNEPIHVFLFEDEARYHAFTAKKFPGLPARRAFFIESDTRLAVYAHWGDRVAEDLRHETAHGYLHAVAPRIPLWLDEGLAEYFEVPRGRQGENRPHVDELRAALAVGDWKPDIARLEKLTAAEAMTQRDYSESWLWAHWLLHESPETRRLLQTYLRSLYGPDDPHHVKLSDQVRAVSPSGDRPLKALGSFYSDANRNHDSVVGVVPILRSTIPVSTCSKPSLR